MKRREFIAAGVAILCTVPARAQQRTPVIGYLGTTTAEQMDFRIPAFKQGLSEAGFVEGKNVAIEYRWAEGKIDRLPALAAEFVKQGVSVIVTPASIQAALAAKGATTIIPIVFETGADPVGSGLVPNLQRPGGNITGVTALTFELGPKRLELLHELVPKAVQVGHLINPTSPAAATRTSALETAARGRSITLHAFNVTDAKDYEGAFAAMRKLKLGGLVISPDTLANSRVLELAQLSLRHSIPAVFQNRQFVAAGGLAAYGGSIPDSHRLAGVQTASVLKGKNPGDLPVQQATKIELFINAKAAKALGVTVPAAVLARADEVLA